MPSTLRVKTRVLPGHRIELTAPDLREGETVEVLLIVDRPAEGEAISMAALLATLPPGPRSAGSWEEIEQRLREERDSWWRS